jgi:hypothetical protein
MSVKFEGKPPFYLGLAEGLSAHALHGSVRARASGDVRKDQRTGEGVSADIGIGRGGRGG